MTVRDMSVKEPGVGSVLEQLESREAVALARVEELRAQALAVADRLDAAVDELSCLVIAKRTVAEVLAGGPGQGPGEAGAVAMVATGSAPGVRGSLRDTAVYERITQAFARAAGPLRVRDVCEALGLPGEPKFIEATRPKLRRLVADGVLAQAGPGLFVTASAGKAS